MELQIIKFVEKNQQTSPKLFCNFKTFKFLVDTKISPVNIVLNWAHVQENNMMQNIWIFLVLIELLWEAKGTHSINNKLICNFYLFS